MSEFRVGTARCNVTPDPLLPVTRGADACRPAEEKLGELEIRVLVLEQNGTRVAIVSTPFLGFPTRLCNQVCLQVNEVEPSNVLIGATHCHSGPDLYGFPNENGEYDIDVDYADSVCEKAAAAIGEAVRALEPAGLRINTGEAQGKIAYNYYAPDLYDPRCHVLQAVRPDGTALATLVNYAIHPEILLEQNVCSPDLVGPLYDRIEAAGGGMGIFMNSAQGGMITPDIRTPDGGEKADWAECERIGGLLAEEALRIVSDAPVQVNPGLWCGAQRLAFPVQMPMSQMLLFLHPTSRVVTPPPHELTDVIHDFPANELLGQHARTMLEEAGALAEEPITEMAAMQNLVNVGNAQILTIPGEALPNIGYFLKRKMQGEHNFLFGLTNDALGYIMSRVDYDSFKIYEYITATCMHEDMGEILVEESLRFVEESPAPANG